MTEPVVLLIGDEASGEALGVRMREVGRPSEIRVAGAETALVKARDLQPDLVLAAVSSGDEEAVLNAASEIRSQLRIPVVLWGDEWSLNIPKYAAFPVLPPGGDLGLILELAHCRTEHRLVRRQMEAAAVNNEAWHEFLMASISDGCFIVDFEGRFRSINKAGAAMMGTTPDELVGRPIEEAVPGLEDTAFFSAVQRSMQARTTESLTGPLTGRHGRLGYCQFRLYPLAEGVLCIGRDISDQVEAEDALRESEERYRLIWKNAMEGIVVLQDGKVVFGNEQTGREIGYTKDEIIDRPFMDFIHPDDREKSLQRYHKRLRGEYVPDRWEVRMITKAGGAKWLRVSAVKIQWAGRPADLMFVTDIHEQKEAEAELKKAHDLLEQRVEERTAELKDLNKRLKKEVAERKRTEERLKQMSFELSLIEERERRRIAVDLHDHIGQCLALSRIKLKSVIKELDDEEAQEGVGQVLELVENMARDTRSLTQELSPPQLYELGLSAALEWLAEHFESNHGLKVNFEWRGSTDRMGDRVQILLFRAVRELLMNVIKHAGATEADLVVERKARSICIQVADRGVGFTENRDIWKVSANGFGLFSIDERLSSIGGRIRIKSPAEGGALVILEAPIRKEKNAKTKL